MKRLLLIFIFFPYFANAKNSHADSIYSFLQQFFYNWSYADTNTANFYIIINRPQYGLSNYNNGTFSTRARYISRDTIASIFSKSDSIEIVQQISNDRKFYFKNGKLQKVKFISEKKLDREMGTDVRYHWDNFYKKMHENGYYCISIPIFYDNGNKAAFYFDYNCGWLCGYGYWSIYEKINGKWVKQTVFSQWVS